MSSGGACGLGSTGRDPHRGPRAGEARWALLFLAPTLIGLAVLSAGPILATLGISLTNWDMLTPPQFVGARQLRRACSATTGS